MTTSITVLKRLNLITGIRGVPGASQRAQALHLYNIQLPILQDMLYHKKLFHLILFKNKSNSFQKQVSLIWYSVIKVLYSNLSILQYS